MKFSDIVDRVGHTDKNTAHTYAPWYDLWFSPHRETARHVLEVGVCAFGGGCVLSLAEYFPNATVWAADIDDCLCHRAVFAHPRIKFLKGNAYDDYFVTHFKDIKLDIIIDDASHEVVDQLRLLGMLRPYMKDGGFYVVEDCCTGHWLPRMEQVWKLGLRQTVVDMATPTVYDNTLIRFDIGKR